MHKIPCFYFRGGTSKGPCFIKDDLPLNIIDRNKILLGIMGSPHRRQIDGIGCGDSLTSKVVIINKSKRPGIDIDYLFCQVHVNDPIVETTLNCGNMLSVVAPLAIERNLVKTNDPQTTVSIYNENTNTVIKSTVQTPGGQIIYHGDTMIDGVNGTGAPIELTFLDLVGSIGNTLLPTGNLTDDIDGMIVSCLDIAGPLVVTYAEFMGKTGYETKHELDHDKLFMGKLETIRRKAALKMGLGDASKSVSPKIAILAPARNGGTITSRYFTPFDCHSSHAISAGLCIAAACLIPKTLTSDMAFLPKKLSNESDQEIIIEHVAGKLSTVITLQRRAEKIIFPKASFIRTARPIFEGYIYI